MKNDGWAGHILHLDMTRLKTEAISTDKYKRWGGGHGLGAALFWDYCKDKTITDGRNPANVCVLAASPFCGTLVPAGGGRTEVTGVGCGQWPVSWFTRSNFGGRFSTMLKYAGWDAVMITGKAEKPVWVEIRNGDVAFRDATGLWGKGTEETQQQIWAKAGMSPGTKSPWKPLRDSDDAGRTTQKPAVLSIGPIGEKSVHGALIHDAGNGAGQCGFGSVWGSKNLKAISVLGTGEVHVADPAGMIQARFKTQEKYVANPDAPAPGAWPMMAKGIFTMDFSGPIPHGRRPQACQSCIGGCRARYTNGRHNEKSCQETGWYVPFARRVFKDAASAGNACMDASAYATTYGMNTYGLQCALPWFELLYEEGVLGPKGRIKSDLPWKQLGRPEFVKMLLDCIIQRTDIGADLAEGYLHALHKWGREVDLETGACDFPYWGMPTHGYDSRLEIEWGYATLMTDRDINSHDYNIHLFWMPFFALAGMRPIRIPADVAVSHMAERLVPYAKGRMECFDYSNENMYSEAVAQAVRWLIHYNRFYKNSLGLCDLKWANFFNTNTKDFWGATASEDAGEQVWWRVVTGENITFAEGIERGRRVYNLDNAIWTLQGRHRDISKFPPYIYKVDATGFLKGQTPLFWWPGRNATGKWEYQGIPGRHIDEAGFEAWKTIFYGLEGWDPKTGWPTRRTLAAMDMAFVADELQAAGKLGKES